MVLEGNGMYILGALLATLFTWGMTAVGAASVFLFKQMRKGLLDCLLGFASGIMIAASFWSLLAPALDMAGNHSNSPYIEVGIGFLVGVFFFGELIVFFLICILGNQSQRV